MERKLVKQGRDALTVTLPSKWLKGKGLKAGQSVYIDNSKNNLVISSSIKSASKETTIDLRGEERSMMWHILIGKYIDGYDKIIILHNSPSITQSFSQDLIGMIVEEHSNSRTILKTIISSPEDNIDAMMRRVTHMLLQQASLTKDVASGVASQDDVKYQERLLDANIYYCLRHINKYHTHEDSYKQFLLCDTIEIAADILSLISKHIKHDLRLASIIYTGVESYNKYIFSKDLKRLYTDLRTFRNNIGQKTFVHGLAFEFAEVLYNNIGYFLSKE